MMMIISTATEVVTSDPEAYAWANLRKFQNVELVEQSIMRLNSSDPPSRRNARKQARQIRYCLIQAREYFTAAKAVSLATKPTLQYYGVMSLALAEILLKQTGDSSLDRARHHHRHHGLLFREHIEGSDSPHLLDQFDPSDIRSVELQEGRTIVGSVNPIQIEAVRDRLFSLGELLVSEGLHS
jgi:hypothetical protein